MGTVPADTLNLATGRFDHEDRAVVIGPGETGKLSGLKKFGQILRKGRGEERLGGISWMWPLSVSFGGGHRFQLRQVQSIGLLGFKKEHAVGALLHDESEAGDDIAA